MSTRLHQVRTLYSEWQAKVPADARERGERVRQLRRHSRSIKEQKKQLDMFGLSRVDASHFSFDAGVSQLPCGT